MSELVEYALFRKDGTDRWQAFKIRRGDDGQPEWLVNHNGGRCRFTDVISSPDGVSWHLALARIMPEGERPLTLREQWATDPDEMLCGLVAPDGTAFACQFMEHAALVDHAVDELRLKDRPGYREAALEALCPAETLREPWYMTDEDLLYAAGWAKVYRPSLFGSVGMAGIGMPDADARSFDECVLAKTRLTGAQKSALERYGLWDQREYNRLFLSPPVDVDAFPTEDGEEATMADALPNSHRKVRTYEVVYRETYEGVFSVEADDPESALKLFRHTLEGSSGFGDYVSSHVDLESSSSSVDEEPCEVIRANVDLSLDDKWKED